MNELTKLMLAGMATLTFAASASAHAIWLERDGSGPVRVYLREIVETVEEPDESHRLKTSTLFTADPAKPVALIAKDKHFEAIVSGGGDVRLNNSDTFAPWVDGGVKHGQFYHARAGRSETVAKLDLEFVPVKSGGSEFVLLLHGKPVAGTAVSLFPPNRIETKLTTDGAGRISVPEREPGRYILEASTTEDGRFRSGGQEVSRAVRVTTLSYVKR